MPLALYRRHRPNCKAGYKHNTRTSGAGHSDRAVAQAQALQPTVLQQASGAAVTTLLKLMIDPATPPSTKARAADSVLDHSVKAIELDDIEARVAELERAADPAKLGR